MSLEQLKGLKEQSDAEVNLLQDSLNNIRTATSRLDITSDALLDLSLRPQGQLSSLSLCLLACARLGPRCFDFALSLIYVGKKMLVPLTASLYVHGTLDDSNKVLVDVGTGYFIEVCC